MLHGWYGDDRRNNMFENMTQEQARKEILDMVAVYCDTYHNQKKTFSEGDRIPYASRVYGDRKSVV